MSYVYVRCEDMADWTSHHFTGGEDEQGKFKGKGELQLKEERRIGKNQESESSNDDDESESDNDNLVKTWRRLGLV